MRVGVLTTSFPRHPEDIAGRFVLELCEALADHGHHLEVLAPQPLDRPTVDGGPQLGIRWIPYLRPRRWQRTFYGAGALDNVRRDRAAFAGLATFPAALAAACDRWGRRWDAIVSHWALPCGWVAGQVLPHKPHLAVCHSADIHLLNGLWVRRLLAEQLAASTSQLVFTSQALRSLFARHLPAAPRSRSARLQVQAMGVHLPNAESESVLAAAAEQRGRPLVVAAMSRMVPLKGLDTLIRAAARCRGVHLRLAGQGPEERRLRRLAKMCGASAEFCGIVTGADKERFLRSSDVFAVPSRLLASGRTEGVPTAMLEAMARGLPVVGSDVGGVREVLAASRAGWVAPPESVEAWAGMLQELARHRSMLTTAAPHARALAAKHSWHEVGRWFDRQLRAIA